MDPSSQLKEQFKQKTKEFLDTDTSDLLKSFLSSDVYRKKHGIDVDARDDTKREVEMSTKNHSATHLASVCPHCPLL